MSIFTDKWRLRIGALLLLLLTYSIPLSARIINVRGTITDIQGTPLYRVSIFDSETQKLLAVTNEDGRYTVKTDSEATLTFSYMGFADLLVPVDGRLTIDARLKREAIALEEVVVRASGKAAKKIVPEKTEIEVRGNYLFIPNTIPINKGNFWYDNRVVIQPILHNVTRKKVYIMKPKVGDGEEYVLTQERMYDFDLTQDPLTPYVDKRRVNHRENVHIIYSDSVYVENPNDDYRCDMIVTLENYVHILSRDTFEVARGTVNPLRLLEYGFSGAPVTDERHLPQPEMELRDTKGDVNLIFRVNKASLDLDEGNNRAELVGLKERLHTIENDPDAKLNGFTIMGTASPEGSYAKNLRLAEARMDWAMSYITDELSESTRRTSAISTSASVEKWESVVAMLRADGHDEEADVVQAAIDKYPRSQDKQSRTIQSLPFYRKLIVPKYLTRLRRVSYELSYSEYRPLSDEEVENLYRVGKYKEIPRFDFWKLYNRAATLEEREAVCRKAIETYPGKFLVASNDLAAILIDKGEGDPELLLPYLSLPDIPHEVRYNQVAAWLLKNVSPGKADSLAEYLPDEGIYHQAKIYAKALNGKCDEVLQEISESSPINEVVMLLAVKEDEIAWEKAQKLGDSAKEDYLRAIASNRLVLKQDRFELCTVAENYLKSAMDKDPSLRDIACIDGDLMNLLKQIENKAKEAEEDEEN